MTAPSADAPKPETPKTDPLLVVLLGPTASGKTALALTLAGRFNGEVVSCDSVAVYRGLEIGSAKPTPEERARAPHHLLDIYAPNEQATAGEYARLARQAIAGTTARKRLPIVTGGTGLYLRALLEGLFDGPARSEDLRARLRWSHARHGANWLRRLLKKLDPAAAARIHANDTPKLIRAIEVSLAARQPITEAWQSGREPLRGYRILRIGLNPERQALYAHINKRAARMFDAGLVEETRALMKKYGEPRVLDSLGYKQARAFIRGELTRAQAVTLAQQGHRNYAKRQLTWFRREPDVHWLQGFGDEAAIQTEAINMVKHAMN